MQERIDPDTLATSVDDPDAPPRCFLCLRAHDYHNLLLRMLYSEFSGEVWSASWVSKPADPEITTMFIDWLRLRLVRMPEPYELAGTPHLQAAFRAAYGQNGRVCVND